MKKSMPAYVSACALALCVATSGAAYASASGNGHEARDLSVQRNVMCKTYKAPAGSYPITSSENVQQFPVVITVPDKFNVLDIAVGMNVTHPNVGALKVTLQNREPCTDRPLVPVGNAQAKISCVTAETRTTRLMQNYGGVQADMYNTYFDDYAVSSLDKTAENPVKAPFTGIFQPHFSIKRIIRGVDDGSHRAAKGGSYGTWSLMVTDRNMGEEPPRGTVDNFEIILCTREKNNIDMAAEGFVPFAQALRAPEPRPATVVVEEEEEEVVVDEDEAPEVEAFALLPGTGQFNPFLEPLQQFFAATEATLLALFSAGFYYKVLNGLIPFPDPGPYLLSDPIEYEETAPFIDLLIPDDD